MKFDFVLLGSACVEESIALTFKRAADNLKTDFAMVLAGDLSTHGPSAHVVAGSVEVEAVSWCAPDQWKVSYVFVWAANFACADRQVSDQQQQTLTVNCNGLRLWCDVFVADERSTADEF